MTDDIRIPFNKSAVLESSEHYIAQSLASGHVSGDGEFTKRCSEWIKKYLDSEYTLLTTSGSHALDMAAELLGILPGDEVIMPSYTFSSTANAFLRRGAKVVFIDIRPDTMNMDERLVEQAVTEKTRAIVPVHYAGVSCEMDEILRVVDAHRNARSDEYGIAIVEDAAQALTSTYKGKKCGTLSDFAAFSFHETKNFSMGEGGALILHSHEVNEQAEIIREKGTNRSKFFRGQIDKYSWVAPGTSYLPSDILAAYLWSQLDVAEEIISDRMDSWLHYAKLLGELGSDGVGRLELPFIPKHCTHNAHMFHIKVADLDERQSLVSYLRKKGIVAPYHYVPLHSSAAGVKYCEFRGEDRYTTAESNRLLRLPMWYGLGHENIDEICTRIFEWTRI